jgi:hypothetical protein
MARGWESKSVEAQIEMAEENRSAIRKLTPSPEKLDLIRKRETVLLSRTRIVRDLESAQNPRYKAMLNKALADLDVQLSTFAV